MANKESKIIVLKRFNGEYEYDQANQILYSVKHNKRRALKKSGKDNKYWYAYYQGKPYPVTSEILEDWIKNPDIRAVDLITKKGIKLDKLDVNFDRLPSIHVRFNAEGKRIKGWTRDEVNAAMRTKPLVIKDPFMQKPKLQVATPTPNDTHITDAFDKQKQLILATNKYLKSFDEFGSHDIQYLTKHFDIPFDIVKVVTNASIISVIKNIVYAKKTDSLLIRVNKYIDFHYRVLFDVLYRKLDALLDSNEDLFTNFKDMSRGERIKYEKQNAKYQETTRMLIKLIKARQNDQENAYKFVNKLRKTRQHESVRKMHNAVAKLDNRNKILDMQNKDLLSNQKNADNKTLERMNNTLEAQLDQAHHTIERLDAKCDDLQRVNDRLNGLDPDNKAMQQSNKALLDQICQAQRTISDLTEKCDKLQAQNTDLQNSNNNLLAENNKFRTNMLNKLNESNDNTEVTKLQAKLLAYNLVLKDLIKNED